MTTRPAPTKASHYVAGILSGLRSFLDGQAAGRLSPDARAEIAQVLFVFCWEPEFIPCAKPYHFDLVWSQEEMLLSVMLPHCAGNAAGDAWNKD